MMAYREPRSLLHGYDVPSGPNIRDSPNTLAKLAKKWDAQKWDGYNYLYSSKSLVY